MTNNENIEINNEFYKKDDYYRKYQAFIFSIESSKMDFNYNVEIKEESDKNELSWWAVALIVIFSIIILFIILIVILTIKKKRGINIENIKGNQPLYPNQKYILTDIMSQNE